MDRSQVRQFGLNRSIYSSKIMGVGSSILHSPRTNTQREIHLKKSRIVNIPQSKSIDFSQKLDFVVVFQAIEIQRMAQEIETSRSRIKQYERQLFSCDNYEIQIKQLTERCYRLQSEKNAYRQELYDNKRASELIFNELEEIKKRYVTVDFTTNEKYKLQRNRNEDLVLQVEKWKARYNALDESKSKELQNIKKMMQQQSKSHLSRQTKQLFDRFELQKQEMQQLIRNLKQMNLEKETELKKFKFQLENKEKQMDQMEKQVDQYEQKIALLSQEHYRFSEMNKSKQIQINKLKDKLKEYEESMLKINQQLQAKNEEYKRITSKLKKIEQASTEKESKLNKLQKMALTDKERLSQLDRIVFLLKQRENQIQSKTKMLQRKDKKLISLEESLKFMQETQTSTKQQISILKQQSQSSTQTIAQLLQRIQHMNQIIRKLKLSTSASEKQIQKHHASFREEINKKAQEIIAYSHKLMAESEENQRYIRKLEEAISENTQKMQSMENDKLKTLQKLQELKEYEQEYDNLYNQASLLKSKLNSAIQQNDRLHQQIRQVQEQKQLLIQEKSSLVKQRSILLKQKEHMISQTQMKQSQIMNQTQMQIRVLQDKYQNNILKNVKQQLRQKERQNTDIKRNIELLERKIRDAQKDYNKKEEQLRSIMETKEIEFAQKYKAFNRDLSQKQEILFKEQKNSTQLRLSLQNFRKYLQTTIKTQIQALSNRIQSIQNAIKTLKYLIGQKLIKEQKNYIQKYKLHEQQITDLIDANIVLMEKNNKLYETLISSNHIDGRSIDTLAYTNNSRNSPKRLDQIEHINATTIYTTDTQSSKLILSPRGANQNYNTSNIVGAGTKIKDTVKGNFNNESLSKIPIEFLLMHVMVCAEVQSLRQRIGDKNAKVQKMKNSLMVSNVSSNKSFVAVVNGNTKLANEQIHKNQGQMMLQSNLMSSTLINKLTNPFNTETSFIQSRLIEPVQKLTIKERQINIRRVTSEERYPVGVSPQSSSILDNSQNKNTGIYTNRMNGNGIMGLGKNGFKSIGIKKSKMYN